MPSPLVIRAVQFAALLLLVPTFRTVSYAASEKVQIRTVTSSDGVRIVYDVRGSGDPKLGTHDYQELQTGRMLNNADSDNAMVSYRRVRINKVQSSKSNDGSILLTSEKTIKLDKSIVYVLAADDLPVN